MYRHSPKHRVLCFSVCLFLCLFLWLLLPMSGCAGSSRQWSAATSITSSAKRIQKELSEITVDPPCNCFAGPKGDNLHEWVSTIIGPPDDPLVGTIARQYLTDRSAHDKTVAEWTRRFAH